MTSRIIHTILILFILLCQSVFSQEVSNLRVRQEGVNIVIQYDLSSEAKISIIGYYYDKQNKRENYFWNTHSCFDGDVNKIISVGKDKRIVFRVLDYFEKDEVLLENCYFDVVAETPYKTFILALGGYSFIPQQPSGGIMVGGVKHLGWYVKARSNFMFKNNAVGMINHSDYGSFEITNSGKFTDESMPYIFTGEKRNMHWIANAGMIVQLVAKGNSTLCWYGGAGYGVREHQLLAYNNQWYTYSPTTFEGVSADTGLLLSINKFALSLGVTTIKFKYLEAELGLGIAL